MLQQHVAAWAKNYFYRGLGKQVPTSLPDDEAKYTEAYHKLFEVPASKFIHEEKQELDVSEASEFLHELQNTKLYSALYNLVHLQNLKTEEDWKKNLVKAVVTFKENKKPYFARCANGKDFITYYDKKLWGVYPENVIALVPNYTKNVNGDCVKYLCAKQPQLMYDYEITAIEKLIEAGWIDVNQLRTTYYLMPTDEGDFEMKSITALKIRKVPYHVRKLIASLPASYIKEHGNQYRAALEYANTHQEYNNCVLWLESVVPLDNRIQIPNTFVAQPEVKTPTVNKPAELNDEVVAEYLKSTYGYSDDQISQVLSKPNSKAIMYSTEVTDDMTVKEMMNKIDDEDWTSVGYLDDLIRKYCKDNNVSLDCTIDQLIYDINYETQTVPKTFKEHCIDYKAAHNNDGNITIDDIIRGYTVEKPTIDKNAIFKEVLEKCTMIAEELKAAILRAVDKKERLEIPKATEIVAELNIPDSLKSKIIATLNGAPFVMPESDALAQVAKKLEMYDGLDDAGFKAGLSLLRDYRTAIIDHDNQSMREDALPLVYGFARMFMLEANNTDGAKEYLLARKENCSTQEIKDMIQKAVDSLN